MFIPDVLGLLKYPGIFTSRTIQYLQLLFLVGQISDLIENGFNSFLQPGKFLLFQPDTTTGNTVINIQKILKIQYCLICQFNITSRAIPCFFEFVPQANC